MDVNFRKYGIAVLGIDAIIIFLCIISFIIPSNIDSGNIGMVLAIEIFVVLIFTWVGAALLFWKIEMTKEQLICSKLFHRASTYDISNIEYFFVRDNVFKIMYQNKEITLSRTKEVSNELKRMLVLRKVRDNTDINCFVIKGHIAWKLFYVFYELFFGLWIIPSVIWRNPFTIIVFLFFFLFGFFEAIPTWFTRFEFYQKEVIIKKAFAKNKTVRLSRIDSYKKVDSLLKGKQWLLMTNDGEKIYIPEYYVNFDMIMNCVGKFNWKERK